MLLMFMPFAWGQAKIQVWGSLMSHKLVFFIYYLSPFYLDFICFYKLVFFYKGYLELIRVENTKIWYKNMKTANQKTWHSSCLQWHGRATTPDYLLLLFASWTSYLLVYFWPKAHGFLWNILLMYFLGLN